MISVVPVRICATNDRNSAVFTLQAADERSALLSMSTMVTAEMLPELFAAITKAVQLLKLEKSE